MTKTLEAEQELVQLFDDYVNDRSIAQQIGLTEWSYEVLTSVSDLDGITREDIVNLPKEVGKTRCAQCFYKRELVAEEATVCESCAIYNDSFGGF